MQLPNKLYSYKDSNLAVIPAILNAIQGNPTTVKDLYLSIRPLLSDTTDFLAVMDCLYALQAIDINEKGEVYSCLQK